MKRVGEIRARRERAFFKHRYDSYQSRAIQSISIITFRMAAAREKHKAHRKKVLDTVKSSVTLREPIATESTKERILVSVKAKSALIQGEGRSMGMDID